ncbi:hypothetical protein D9611_011603 [Ephemerocybe angulata]|uniref:ATP-dependent DNA helicase n=1 Tax=Ephemerocybe angulata TaxID=980116 RepID=A0A8H5AVU8_9AGAR|nr:hypothetical protein D9611_011603 [Tulosesus angulatus]
MSHLKPLSETHAMNIIKEWQKAMDPSMFIKHPCAVCSTLFNPKELARLDSTSFDLSLLRNDSLPLSVRPTSYDFLAYDRAILDPEGLENKTRRGWIRVCKTCLSDLRSKKMPKFALANWLYYARDCLPTEVKHAFESMSVFEKALICRVRINSLLCRFTGIEDDTTDTQDLFVHGRRHIRGNIMSTPLDAHKLHNILPPSPSDIADTICALIVSASPPTKRTVASLKPILVRKSRIKLLLDFLITNNPHYRRSESFRGFSADYLDNLFQGPDDVGVPASVNIGHVPINHAVDSLTEDYVGRLDGLNGLFMENVSYTDGDHSPESYRNMALLAIQRCKEGKPFIQAKTGSTPVPDINNPSWLSWAHPNADPFGIGGFHEPRRSRPIGMLQQLRHLLTVRDPFFENDPELAFDIYNIVRKGSVNTSMRFTVPFTTYDKISKDIAALDKVQIASLRERFQRDPTYAPTTESELAVTRVLASISPVARDIPGTVSQKIKMRNEIRAIISQRGSPTLFVTVNPSDYHHPIVTVLAQRPMTQARLADLDQLTSSDRTRTALKHPVACAQFFDTMMRNFISIVLRCDRKKKSPGIFGRCDCYYGTVETQGRGSLHCHMLVWLKNHLPPETLATTLKNSPEYRAALIKWLDSIMDSGFLGSRSNTLEDESVEAVPQPRRSSDPHPACIREPKIAEMPTTQFRLEMQEHVDLLLRRFNWHSHTGTCWKYLKPKELRSPENCRFRMDGTTIPVTSIDSNEGTISIRRRHPRMTSYNPIVTFLLKCNTDIKFIGSGTDAKAFMYYVTDYITKAPLSMHAGLTALSYAIQQAEARSAIAVHPPRVVDPRRTLTIAINSMLGRQEISHPQVMSYILGGGEYYTSETFQPINWGEVKRYVSKAFESTEEVPQPGPPTPPWSRRSPDSNIRVAMTNDGTRLSASNQLLDYIYRPPNEPFESMSLYTFIASTRRTLRSKSRTPEKSSRSAANTFSSEDHPQFYTHTVGLRRTHAVPVLLGPRIARKDGCDQERESWGSDMCILFYPWRSPISLRDPQRSWYKTALDVIDKLSHEEKVIVSNMTLISEGRQARDDRPRHKRQGPSSKSLMEMEAIPDIGAQAVSGLTNAYALPSGDDDPGDPTMESAFQSDPYLGVLLGDDRVDAVRRCYQAPSTTIPGFTSQIPPRAPIEAETGSKVLDKQRVFMSKARFAATSSQGSAKKGASSKKSTTRTGQRDHDPNLPQAEIATLVAPQTRGRFRSLHQDMNLAEDLAYRRGLRDNPEQLRAFLCIAEHVLNGGPQLQMYVGGPGGTGKSYLIETTVELFESLGRGDEIRLGAFTGIAASLIGGSTLHSLLGMGVNTKKPAIVAKRLSDEWRRVKYLIIDEVSMISAQFLAATSSKMRTAKGDDALASQKPFGGVNMIFMGDFFQLSPPTQPSLFSYKLVRKPSFLEARNNDGIDAIAGAFLWRQVSTVVLLKESKRHADDPIMTELLDRIRNRTCLDQNGQPVKVAGKTVLDHIRSRDIAFVASTDPESLTGFQDAPVIVGNKDIRDSLNSALLKAHAHRTSTVPNIYFSTDYIKKQRVTGTAALSLWNLPSRPTKDNLGQLPMFVGMKVMVTENVSISYKIVNGSEGTITDIIYSTDNSGRRYAEAVYIKLTGAKRNNITAPGLEPGIIPIFPTATSIPYPVRLGQTVAKSFSRRQIPLIPAYSYTDYKSQGRTLKRAIVDLTSSQGQGIYVMLSRVTSLKGLLILRWFPQTKILQDMSGELREETDRLDRLDKASGLNFYEDHHLEAKEADEIYIERRMTSNDNKTQSTEDVEMEIS